MFKVSARTVLELGSELISSDIIALYELIKNGFDAGSKNGVSIYFEIVIRKHHVLSLVELANAQKEEIASLKESVRCALLTDAPPELIERANAFIDSSSCHADLAANLQRIHDLNRILVVDNGSGMSKDDLTANFLTIGTASRRKAVDEAIRSKASRAPYLGEKGIGRLSAMRLGNTLTVTTARKSDRRMNELHIDWSKFDDLDAYIEDIQVNPTAGALKQTAESAGTTIILGKLVEDWSQKRVQQMVDIDFARLTDPFADQKTRPRILIYWNGERLSIPWMSSQLLEAAHAKISGSYVVEKGKPSFTCRITANNLGYAHPKEEQIITLDAHDLQSCLAGAHQETVHDSALASVGNFEFEAYWYNRRRLTGIDGIGDLKSVRELLQKWSGVLLFRDGFRVFPYGEDEDDWLALDRKALGRSGYTLNKTQFVGRSIISRTKNPFLIDQTNREGLRHTAEREVFVGVFQFAITQLMFNFLRDMDQQYKFQKVDLNDSKEDIATLEKRAASAIKRLRKVVPLEESASLEEIEQTFFEFMEFSEKARQRITEVEQESRQMIELAGVGMMVEVVAHELARASENALENLETLRQRNVPSDIRQTLESLRAQMKSLSKRVRILDPLSISGRQRAETFDLEQLILETFSAHEGQFARHSIEFHFTPSGKPLLVRAVKGMIVQILENLISNSKYWLEIKRSRDKRFIPKIQIAAQAIPASLLYSDNGVGIAPENKERIFKPFFSLKEKQKRRGLGLFIARECAEHNGASLYLSEITDAVDNRLHQFILEFPSTLK